MIFFSSGRMMKRVLRKFAYEYSVEKIPFLDLKVGLKDGKIATDLHMKPTDRHQYLHFS